MKDFGSAYSPLRTIDSLIRALSSPNMLPSLPPIYTGDRSGPRVMLGVESMRFHMTDEGWQLQLGLEAAGYQMCGYQLPICLVDVVEIVNRTQPGTLVLQDKREWEGLTAGGNRDPAMQFRFVTYLAERPDIFKLTVLKDAHNRPHYHAESADEMATHGWIIYYHPRVVSHVAPFVRPEHCVRTYHCLEPSVVPAFDGDRVETGAILSGALSKAYPLREQLAARFQFLPETYYHLRHPGYNRFGCVTPEYLKTLSHFKVAICTSSVYGYALRKIIEATACGCVVLTDLPIDEVMPEIDDNLVRLNTAHEMLNAIPDLCQRYDSARQARFAALATAHYDWRAVGQRLADDIETLRRTYPTTERCNG